MLAVGLDEPKPGAGVVVTVTVLLDGKVRHEWLYAAPDFDAGERIAGQALDAFRRAMVQLR